MEKWGFSTSFIIIDGIIDHSKMPEKKAISEDIRSISLTARIPVFSMSMVNTENAVNNEILHNFS